METKELKINIPVGYEVDTEKSTFENIVFKKKQTVNCWEDIENISGIWIGNCSNFVNYAAYFHYKMGDRNFDKNIFLNEKYAKSALALAQISQLLPYYDSKVNWNECSEKVCIVRACNNLIIEIHHNVYQLLAFNTYAEAARFLIYNEQLIKDYYMMED